MAHPAQPLPQNSSASTQGTSDSDNPDTPVVSGGESEPGRPRALGTPRWQRRWLRGTALLVLGYGVAFLLMANDSQVPRGALWGFAAMLLGTVGLLDLLGSWRTAGPEDRPVLETCIGPLEGEPLWMSPLVSVPAAVTVLLLGAWVGGYEHLPAVILAAIALLSVSALRRPGLLALCLVSGIYLPLLGSYGLWDPWETHYGEVAREILARDDWISLWWAQENWFWSKPILIFWSEALTLSALGVPFTPDANPGHPEWAVRLPVALMSLGAVVAVYAAVSRVFSKRAGLLAALVLASMPHFAFLSRQAITDIPFVANMTIALSLLILAVHCDPQALVQHYRIGRLQLSGRHAALGALAMVSVPQILYLASRNITMVGPFLFAWGRDVVHFGSAGNDGVPGNAAPYDLPPHLPSLIVQPLSQSLVWALGLGLLLWILRREQRRQALLMLGFYLFCAFALMGKGLPGVGLPGLVALLYLVGSQRWSLLLEGRFRIALGMLTVAVVGMPWYVAMFARHGPAFTDRLLVHDHLNRLASGVHGDKGAVDYFLAQLGYGTFPWAAVLPAAAFGWIWFARSYGGRAGTSTEGADEGRRSALWILSVWLVAAFVLFNAMVTKFHHYIFPVVPPAAVLVALLLDSALGSRRPPVWREGLGVLMLTVGMACFVLGTAGLWGDVRGVVPKDVAGQDWVLENPWPAPLAVSLIAVGTLATIGAFVIVHRLGLSSVREWLRSKKARPVQRRTTLAVVFAAASAALLFIARDLAWVTSARPAGYERLIHLFVYRYDRPWPSQFDYRPILTGFGVVAVSLFALGLFRRLQPMVARAAIVLALGFTTWTLNVYLIDLSPHWGQRELVRRYYAARADASEPLVAWQMNWKGENFYTGNRVSVFVDLDNKKIRDWIAEHAGTRAFFILEHGRMAGLRGLLRGRTLEEITTKRENNKFILVQAKL